MLSLLVLLMGCEDSLDAQEYEHNRDYDRYSITIDVGSAIVRQDNGRGSTRGVAQYQGSTPTVRVEVIDRVLEIEGTCGERTTNCAVDFFVDVQNGVQGSLQVGSGTVQLVGLTGDHTVDVTEGTLRATELGMGLLIGDASGDITAEWLGFPDQVAFESSAGSVELSVPTGDYALTVSGASGETIEGVTDDPASTRTIQALAPAGSVTITGT